MKEQITLKDRILALLNKEEAKSYEVLRGELGLCEIEELTELSKTLVELQQKYKISTTKKGKYMLFNDPKIKIGRLEVKSRDEDRTLYGFVVVEGMEKDIFINSKNLNGALDGETVRVEIIGGRKDRPEGAVAEVLEKKSLDNLVGEVVLDEKGRMFVVLDDKKMNLKLAILDNPLKAVSGHKVLVTINRNDKRSKKGGYVGEILKIIGHKNEPGVDILSIAFIHGFTNEWPADVLESLKNIPDALSEKDYIGRRDLRSQTIFTIDGDDTKDIDDAVSVKKLDNGNYLVGVHIANVSHYVPKGSALDKEAYRRGTSVYMIDTVIPMLPPQLSNGICSLNPNVDRLAMSCDMEIDAKGNVVNHEIYASVIKSAKQMTYKNVNKILEENIIPEGYEEFEATLRMLNVVALILRNNKFERGMLEFSSKEVKFVFDEKHIPIEIVKREQRSGEKLIEDLMIVANETVASHFTSINYPSIYRVLETPDEEKVAELVNIVVGLGVEIPNKNKKYNLYPKAFQELMNLIKTNDKVYRLVSPLALRTQKKAYYTPYNVGHFGLASECYTHFTSPIRRYPDKKLHELIEIGLFNNDYSSKTIAELEESLPYTCGQSSTREKDAEQCEREADDMKTAEMMSYHIGEQFKGIVTGVIRDAMFIELENNAEGRLHISELKDDTYIFNEELYRMEGQNTKKMYSFGDEITIIVKASSKETSKVDFEMPPIVKDTKK